jgi:hypothetical protein
MLQIYVIKGIGDVWPAQIRDKQGDPMTGVYDGTESIEGVVWSGEDESILVNLPVSWDTPAAGTVKIMVPAAAGDFLDVGLYQGLVRMTDGSEALIRFTLDVRHAPGSAVETVQPYCTLEDLLRIAPWVKLIQGEEDLAGFLGQRLEARQKIDWTIINNYRGASVGLFETHSTLAFAFGGGVGWRRSLGPSPSLVTYLAEDKLIRRPQIVRAAAYAAIAEVARAQIGIANQWAAQGPYYEALYERELAGTTAEIDLNGDGIGELFINLGSTNPLMT